MTHIEPPYSDVMTSWRHDVMSAMASQITSFTIVYQMASNAENVSIWWRHHEMAWRLLGAKPLSEPIGPKRMVKFQSKFGHFHSRKDV